MSTVQRRNKNISKIPLLDMPENTSESTFVDPRSPSANVSRTPVDLHTYRLPTLPASDIIPTNRTR